MTEPPAWIVPTCIAFAALCAAALFAWARSRQRRAEGPPPATDTLQMTCSVCQHPLVVSAQQMTVLSPAEMGLVVRGKPAWVKRKLAEYTCPHCSAAHVFAIDATPPAHLGADLYTPRARGNRCMECNKAMPRPSFPKGAFDGKIAEAPIGTDHGLECQFCKAVFCYECADRVSRHKKKDGTLYCPRCFRHPVIHIFHG